MNELKDSEGRLVVFMFPSTTNTTMKRNLELSDSTFRKSATEQFPQTLPFRELVEVRLCGSSY